MSTGTQITLDEFRERYGSEHGVEFWFGEVVRKGVPTWLHALLQGILVESFTNAGYASGTELDLRIDSEFEPKPDVVAALVIEDPYPTKPVDIVAEVLSPDDKFNAVIDNCVQYTRIGIPQIFVFDPQSQRAWEWNHPTENLERIKAPDWATEASSILIQFRLN
jgi:Uma2 family endonuclease